MGEDDLAPAIRAKARAEAFREAAAQAERFVWPGRGTMSVEARDAADYALDMFAESLRQQAAHA